MPECAPRSFFLCWPGALNKAKRSLAYVKDNEEIYGLKVVSRDLKTFQINWLNCNFCTIFSLEATVGSKRKPTRNVQEWRSPFRYDNIDAHLENQPPSKWSGYKKLEKNESRIRFFEYFIEKHRNNMSSHFIPESTANVRWCPTSVGISLTWFSAKGFILLTKMTNMKMGPNLMMM